MKAIRVHEVGEPEMLRYEEVATPEPGQGECIDRKLPLAEAAEAHRLLAGRKTAGKLLLVP